MTSSNFTTLAPANSVMAASSSDVYILSIGIVLAALYLFRDQLFSASKPKTIPPAASKHANGSANPRDFIAKMKEAVSIDLLFFSSLFTQFT
jgi:NADPH-ferrihemoprotein reductase